MNQPRGLRSNDHRPHGKDQLARVTRGSSAGLGNVDKLIWPWLCGEAQLSMAKVEKLCLPGPAGEAQLALVTWGVAQLALATWRRSSRPCHMEKLM
jgi:hypothetical protein